METTENTTGTADQAADQSAAQAGADQAKATKAAKKPVPVPDHDDCVYMQRKGDEDAVVNVNSIDAMVELGWSVKTK